MHARNLTMLKGRYVRASESGDEDAVKQVRKDFEAEQQARERDGFKRQSPTLLSKAPKAKEKREKSMIGGIPYTKANKEFVRRQVESEELEPASP
jgi:hypothetical protein